MKLMKQHSALALIFTLLVSCLGEQSSGDKESAIALGTNTELEGKTSVINPSQKNYQYLTTSMLEGVENDVVDYHIEEAFPLEDEVTVSSLEELIKLERADIKGLLECLKTEQGKIFRETIEKLKTNALMEGSRFDELEGHGDKLELLSRIQSYCSKNIDSLKQQIEDKKSSQDREGTQKISELKGKYIKRVGDEGDVNSTFFLLEEILSEKSLLLLKKSLSDLESNLELKDDEELKRSLEALLEKLQEEKIKIDNLVDLIAELQGKSDVRLKEFLSQVIEERKIFLKLSLLLEDNKEILLELEKLRNEQDEALEGILAKLREGDFSDEKLIEVAKRFTSERKSLLEKLSQKIEDKELSDEELKEIILLLKNSLDKTKLDFKAITGSDEFLPKDEDSIADENECRRQEKIPECQGKELLVEQVDAKGCLSYQCTLGTCPSIQEINCEAWGMRTEISRDFRNCEKLRCVKDS